MPEKGPVVLPNPHTGRQLKRGLKDKYLSQGEQKPLKFFICKPPNPPLLHWLTQGSPIVHVDHESM
jgi:hypothetical protein